MSGDVCSNSSICPIVIEINQEERPHISMFHAIRHSFCNTDRFVATSRSPPCEKAMSSAEIECTIDAPVKRTSQLNHASASI